MRTAVSFNPARSVPYTSRVPSEQFATGREMPAGGQVLLLVKPEAVVTVGVAAAKMAQ